MHSASANASKTKNRCFDEWAQVYDEQPNPMLSLEQRTLDPLLKSLAGKDVLDLGGGTGRWTSRLSTFVPNSLLAIDSSPMMLRKLRERVGFGARPLLAQATELPLRDVSIDFVLASFVVSYIKDLRKLAEELRRILRAGGEAIITDIHPETCRVQGWRRGFKVNGSSVTFDTFDRSMETIISTFTSAGLHISWKFEPRFGAPEREILARNGKLDVYHRTRALPPIYLLKIRSRRYFSSVASRKCPAISLTGCEVATSALTTCRNSIDIRDGIVREITNASPVRIDLNGYLVIPGLINAHDHLEFGLFPRLGVGPYTDATQWASDIHTRFADVIAQHRSVPRNTRLWWGALRNLLSGVTTVCHHNPYETEFSHPDFPLRVVHSYGWAHSLALEPRLLDKVNQSPHHLPFILHLAEGTSRESREEIFRLRAMGALNSASVLVHGLALDHEGVLLLNDVRAAVVYCPSSARFLYGSAQTAEFVRSIGRVGLGTDSPLTCSGDLLDETRFCHSHMGLSPAEIYAHVTSSSAGILHLQAGEGSINIGSVADLIAIKNDGRTPAEALVRSSFINVELVLLGGRIQLVSDTLRERLPSYMMEGLEPLYVDNVLRWVRAPVRLLMQQARAVLGQTITISGRQVSDAPIS